MVQALVLPIGPEHGGGDLHGAHHVGVVLDAGPAIAARRRVPGQAILLTGHAVEQLRRLRGEIQSIICSPPYFGARKYPAPDALFADGWMGQLGHEKTVDQYVTHLVEIFSAARETLRDDGTLWVVIGDGYAAKSTYRAEQSLFKAHGWKDAGELRSTPGRRERSHGIKPKDLLLVPFELARALRSDGWYLRFYMPWVKRAEIPNSVKDRPACLCETILMLSKGKRYYYDIDATRVPHSPDSVARQKRARSGHHKYVDGGPQKQTLLGDGRLEKALHEGGRSRRASDWFLDSLRELLDGGQGLVVDPASGAALGALAYPKGIKEAHFAIFPERLIEPLVKSSSRTGDNILDVFSGSATTGLVATRLNRNYVGIDAASEYTQLGARRLHAAGVHPRVE